MPRPIRIWFPEAVYHIIQRGNSQQDIFHEEGDYIWLLRTIKEVQQEKKFILYAYALMTNHYHLIIQSPYCHISEVMHAINSKYALCFNKKYQKSGHLFQGRFKDILVDTDSYLLELSRYIHLNPVKAGLVNKPEEYRWSSYRAYIKGNREEIVDTALIFSQFQSNASDGYKDYAEFVNDRLELIKEEQDWLKQNLRRQRFLGNKEFIVNITKRGQAPFSKNE